MEFHQNAEGHVKGERWKVVEPELSQLHSVAAQDGKGKQQQIDLGHAERFSVYRQEELALAKGDKIRITKGGKTREGTRINNGDLFTVKGFTKDGHIKLHTGKTVDKEFGHLTHGYVTTSHSSQGKTVDQVFIAQSSQSMPASSQQQFYVSISRGRERCRIYTDDKRELEGAVKQDGQRMTAREIAAVDRQRSKRNMQEKESHSQPKKQKEHARGNAI